jgi:hypothetical protein
MTESVLRPYFHSGVAGTLARIPGLGLIGSLASPMQALAHRVQRDPVIVRALESDLDDSMDAAKLAALLARLAEKLAEVQTTPIPPWVRVAQETRDWLPFTRLPMVADRLAAALCDELRTDQAVLVHGYLSDALRAIDVFSQRFTAGQEAAQLAGEVQRRFFAMRMGEQAAADSRVDADRLANAIEGLVRDWARCTTDMGVVVDLEFLRLAIERLLVPFRLGEEEWASLVLALDAGLLARAGDRCDHALRNAIDALLDLRPLLGFLRDLAEGALLHLPADAQLWGETCMLLAVSGVEASGELSRRIAEAANLSQIAADFGHREAELLEAVHLGAQSLRRHWERNFIDHYTAAADRLAAWGRVAASPSDPDLALAERLAVAGRDARERRVLAFSLLARIPQERHAGILRACAALDSARSGNGDSAAIRSMVSQVAAELAKATPLPRRQSSGAALAANLLERSPVLLRAYGPTTVGADLTAEIAVLLGGPDDHSLSSIVQELASHIDAANEPTVEVVLGAVRRQQAAQLLKRATSTLLDGLVEAAARQGLVDPRIGAYAELLLRQLLRMLGGRCESPRDSMLRLTNHLRSAGLAVRSAEQRPLHELLAGRAVAAMGVETGALVAEVLDFAASRTTGIDPRRTRVWDRVDAFAVMHEYGPLWASVFAERRFQAPHHGALAELVERLDSERVSPAILSCWRTYATAWSRLADPFAAWSPALQGLLQIVTHDQASELRTAWVQAAEELTASADPSLAAFLSLLLADGLDRFNRWAQARATRDWAGLALGSTLSVIGHPDLQPLLIQVFELEAEETASVRSGLATLNIARFLVERVVSQAHEDRAGWATLWSRLHDAAHAAFEDPAQRILLARQLGRYAAICRKADGFKPAVSKLLRGKDPFFADDPAEEAEWRAFVGGVLACAALREVEPGLVDELALSTPWLDRRGAAAWAERAEALQAVLEAELPRALSSAVRQVIAAVGSAVARAGSLAVADACSGLDCALALRPSHPTSEPIWRLDRLVRNRLEGLTSPMPGDLNIRQVLGWTLVEGLALRRAAHMLAEFRQLDADLARSGEHATAPLVLPTIAARSAFLRDGLPTPALRIHVSMLLTQHWAAMASAGGLASIRDLRQRILEEFGQDSPAFERFAEYSHCAESMIDSLSSAAALRSILTEWVPSLSVPSPKDSADEDSSFMAAAAG